MKAISMNEIKTTIETTDDTELNLTSMLYQVDFIDAVMDGRLRITSFIEGKMYKTKDKSDIEDMAQAMIEDDDLRFYSDLEDFMDSDEYYVYRIDADDKIKSDIRVYWKYYLELMKETNHLYDFDDKDRAILNDRSGPSQQIIR